MRANVETIEGIEHGAVVIGAGQAGLAVGHELFRSGVPFAVLERDRVGSSWAALWDSFRINTPNWSVRLPDMPYTGEDPEGFMSRSEIVSYLEGYARSLAGTIHEGIEVTGLSEGGGGFRLETTAGRLTAACVIVCTGAYQAPFRPPGADALPPDLVTLDTRTYRAPDDLPAGAVLVVGSGQSGCQIAEELVDSGRAVILSCGKAAWGPRRIGGHDLLWWGLETGFLDQTPDELPSPAARFTANVTASGVDGGHDLHLRSLRAKGVTLVGRFTGYDEGRFRFADDLQESIAWSDARYLELREDVETLCAARGIRDPELPDPEPFDTTAPGSVAVSAVGSVIFSGGFRPDYRRWVHVPGAFDEMGFPLQHDGASVVTRGLYFAGVHFLRKRKSSLLCGVGEDAAVIADDVKAHLATRGSAPGA
jgi:putative flavoprotein involved in K+ transport